MQQQRNADPRCGAALISVDDGKRLHRQKTTRAGVAACQSDGVPLSQQLSDLSAPCLCHGLEGLAASPRGGGPRAINDPAAMAEYEDRYRDVAKAAVISSRMTPAPISRKRALKQAAWSLPLILSAI